MPVELSEDIELHLAVGLPAVLGLDIQASNPTRHRTALRGWHKGTCVILDAPLEGGLPPVMAKGQPCVVRYMKAGSACGFDAKVLERASPNRAFFQVTWPEHVEVLRVRKYERTELVLPCTIVRDGGREHKGELRDISAGGCRVFAKTFFPASSTLRVSLSLPDGTAAEGLPLEVRSVTKLQDGVVHGCQFTDEDSDAVNMIRLFLSASEQPRSPSRSTADVLIVEEDAIRAGALSEILEEHGYRVAATAGVVDAFSRLRAMGPRVVLVQGDHPELPGIEIARVLTRTAGLEALPVFLYGGGPEMTEACAREAGAMQYFACGDDPASIADELLMYMPTE